MSTNENHFHPYGKPENVLKFSEDDKVVIVDDLLQKVFQNEEVKYRKIVTFSIIGAFRKGKSFFLDYCLRFMYAHYPSINYPNNPVLNSKEWMGDEDEPLLGFSWRSGANRDTTGIILWNDIFLHTDERTGEKFAIIIMDTQGLFDNHTSPLDNSRIFALGTLISSNQVLNLSDVIQEDQLQYLQFATEFARFTALDDREMNGKPFQNLTFLMRDWVNDEDFEYGMVGGNQYLKSVLEINSNQKEELKSVREFIHNSFDQLNCFLLPHPGKAVTGSKKNSKKFDGNWGAMDEDFKEELVKLIEELLKPEKLIVKKINGTELIGNEFLEYVNQYFKLFQSDELPPPQTIYESTIDKQMNLVVNSCFEKYKELIFKNKDLLSDYKQIPIFHDASKHEAHQMYKESRKMGNSKHEAKYQEKLDLKINKFFVEWQQQTEASIKYVQDEMEKTRKEIEEKHKRELEQKEEENKALEKYLELEKEHAKDAIKHERALKEKEIADVKAKAEQDVKAAKESLDLCTERVENQINVEKTLIDKKTTEEKQKAELEFEMTKKQIVEEQIKIENKISETIISKELEIAEARLKSEKERSAKIEAEKEKEKAFREKLQAELNSKEWEKKYHDMVIRPFYISSSIYSPLPSNSVEAGYDIEENPIYIGHAIHGNVKLPAKIIPSKKVCYILHDGVEVCKERYSVLTGVHFKWKEPLKGEILSNAEITGYTENDEPIYIVRAHHEGELIPGQIIGRKSIASILYKGKEVKKDVFEYLVHMKPN